MNQTIIKFSIIGMVLLVLSSSVLSFKSEQKKYPRVKTAYAEKEADVLRKLTAQGIKTSEAYQLYLRVFKEENMLELWAKNNVASTFRKIDSFEICDMSGELGPKRRQGDRQVPEGFYHIDRFNPQSFFYLSLGINYPNTSDRLLGEKGKLGGDIFIHGACVSIGCMAMTDENIKSIYLYAVEAYNSGQSHIPVTIFPARLSDRHYQELVIQQPEQKPLWTELKNAYDLFNRSKKTPIVTFLSNGRHEIKAGQ